jgi:hypothetical protein
MLKLSRVMAAGHLEFPISKRFTSLVQDHSMIIPAKSQIGNSRWPAAMTRLNFNIGPYENFFFKSSPLKPVSQFKARA